MFCGVPSGQPGGPCPRCAGGTAGGAADGDAAAGGGAVAATAAGVQQNRSCSRSCSRGSCGVQTIHSSASEAELPLVTSCSRGLAWCGTSGQTGVIRCFFCAIVKSKGNAKRNGTTMPRATTCSCGYAWCGTSRYAGILCLSCVTTKGLNKGKGKGKE